MQHVFKLCMFRTGMEEWIMENLWGCFFDVELKTLRDFGDFTRKISTSAAFSVSVSVSWNTLLSLNILDVSLKVCLKIIAGHFVEQVCHPLQWLGVKYSLSCGFLQFPIFDIFVDLGLSRCTLPALLRSPASQFEANIYKSFQPFSDLRSFHSVSICVEIQPRFYNHWTNATC